MTRRAQATCVRLLDDDLSNNAEWVFIPAKEEPPTPTVGWTRFLAAASALSWALLIVVVIYCRS